MSLWSHRGRSNTIISPPTPLSVSPFSLSFTLTRVSLKFHQKKWSHHRFRIFRKLTRPLFTGTHASAVYRVFKHHHYLFFNPTSLYLRALLTANRWVMGRCESPISVRWMGASDRCLCMEQGPGASAASPPLSQLRAAAWRNYFHMLAKRTVSLFSKQRISTSEGQAYLRPG